MNCPHCGFDGIRQGDRRCRGCTKPLQAPGPEWNISKREPVSQGVALRNGCLIIAATIGVLFLFAPTCRKADPAGGAGIAEISSNGDRAKNLAGQVEIVTVQSVWAPGKASEGGPNLCWVQPTIRNSGSVPVRLVWARIKAFERNGRVVLDVEDIIYYADDLPGQPAIAPGQTYSGNPYDVGDPFFPMDGGVPLRDEPLTFRVTVLAAYNSTNVNKDGSPAAY